MRTLPRLWPYPGSIFSPHKIHRTVCESVVKTSLQFGQGHSVPKIRRLRPARVHGPTDPLRDVHEIHGWSSRQLSTHRGVYARLHRRQHWLIAVAAQDIDELRAIGGETFPTPRLRDLARIGLVEAHARQHSPARILY